MRQPEIPVTRRLTLISTLALVAGSLCGAEPTPDFAARLLPIPPCSPLVSAARANKIPLDQVEPPTQCSTLDPGDSVTALVTFREKDARLTRWLVHVEVVAPRPGELPDQPATSMVIHTSTGNIMEFTSSPAIMSLRTLGPFAGPVARRKSPKVEDRSAGFGLNQDFLGLGLDKAAAVVLRLKQSEPMHTNKWFSFAGQPSMVAEVDTGRKLAERVKLTWEEERALAGLGPALVSYFTIVQRTAELEDILFKILDMPSVCR